MASLICRQSKTALYYNSYGSVERQEEQPDLSDATYDRTIVRTFDPNISAWIVSLPSSETVYKGIGTLEQKAKTEYFYDSAPSCQTTSYFTMPVKGRVTAIRYWLQDGASPEKYMAYDSYGNKVCEKDPRTDMTNITTYVYDPIYHKYLKQIQWPANKIPATTFTYYGVDGPADNGLFGQLRDTTDANSKTTTITYDKFGRRRVTYYPDSTWERLTYTDTGGIGVQNVMADNSAGLWSIGYFDGMNKTYKTESSGPDSKTIVIDTVFDARNALYATSFPYFKNQESPRWTTLASDYLGRVTAVTKPYTDTSTATVKAFYGLRTIDIINENGHATRQTFNGLGLLAKVDEFKGAYSLPPDSGAVPYGHTIYEYDVLGKLTKIKDAKNNTFSIGYDTIGRKTAQTDPDMGSWSYTYYPNGLLNTVTDAKHQTITLNYDELSRPTKKLYPDQSYIEYRYDEPGKENGLGRLTSVINSANQARISYSYDPVGRVKTDIRSIDSRTFNISYGYDVGGRLYSITYPDLSTARYDYNGPALLRVYDGTTNKSYAAYSGYNALLQPDSIYYGNGVIANKEYYPLTNWLKHLRSALYSGGVLQQEYIDREYAYDPRGNLTRMTDNLTSMSNDFDYITTTYSPSPARPHAVASVTDDGGTYQVQQDGNGNTTNDRLHSYGYDVENRLKAVDTNAVVFEYDGKGERVKKTTSSHTVYYADKLHECTGTGCGNYIFVGNTRIAIKQANDIYYYHPDHLGSTAMVADGNGQKVEAVGYFPFGETRSDTGAPQFTHKYTGQELDSETGLYNYNARMYNPGFGRFMSPDIIVPNPGNPQSLNRYAYVRNNPMNLVDPTGHDEGGDGGDEGDGGWGVPEGDPGFVGPPSPPSNTMDSSSPQMNFTISPDNLGINLLGANASPLTNADGNPGATWSIDGLGSALGDIGSKAASAIGSFFSGWGGSFATPGLSGTESGYGSTLYNPGAHAGFSGVTASLGVVAHTMGSTFTTQNILSWTSIGLGTAATTATVIGAITTAPAWVTAGTVLTGAAVLTTGLNMAYSYTHLNNTNLTSHTITGSIAIASLATVNMPAVNILVRALDISNTMYGSVNSIKP